MSKVFGAPEQAKIKQIILSAMILVGQRNCEDLAPVPWKVSQTWLSREKALTAEKLKVVLPAGMLCWIW